MYCSKCGNQLPDGSLFCNKCGFNTNAIYQNLSPKNYLADINFRNSSEEIKNLFSKTDQMRLVGLALLLPSIFSNIIIGPIFPPLYILTIPALIFSIIVNVQNIKRYKQLKKLYLEYINRYQDNTT